MRVWEVPDVAEQAISQTRLTQQLQLGWTLYKEGDIIGPAKGVLFKLLQSQTVAPHTQHFYEVVDGEPVTRIEMNRLVDVLWAQFQHVHQGAIDLRFCAHCGADFGLKQRDRSDRQFCSDPCKAAHLYARKSTARKMRREGRGLREIVAAVGVPEKSFKENMAQVKRWVTGVK